MADNLELIVNGGAGFDVRRFAAYERISSPFEVHVVAMSLDADIDLEEITGKEAALTVLAGNPKLAEPLRTWKGICQNVQATRAEYFEGSAGYSTYTLSIVPRMWLLTQNREHRKFQRKTIPEILEELLGKWNVEFAKRLNATYPKLDYVVQYGESDFHFISRLMERAGITYFFDHADDQGGKLTLSDEPHSAPARAPVTYNPNPHELRSPEHFSDVAYSERVTPGIATLRDHDFRRPTFALFGSAAGGEAPEDFYEIYRYRPGASVAIDSGGGTPVADDKGAVRWVDDEAKARATRELESHRAQKKQLGYRTNCLDFFPGVVFSVEEHPHPALAEPWLATEFEIMGSANRDWQMVGRAVAATVPYRPLELHDDPVVDGIQSAVVVGPSGEEIYTDEFGRVRVQFHWDREGKLDPDSSCWMRVNQPWAGTGFGQIMIPRIGHEVFVRYFEGDPDRPVVGGRTYNVMNVIPSEHELPRYSTRSGWQTNTSPSAPNSYNALRFEDQLDNEYIFSQAQRDQQKLVKRHETERTGQNRLELVGKNRMQIVANVDAKLVGSKYSLQMMTVGDFKIPQLGIPEATPLPTKLEMVDENILVTSGEATAMFKGGDIAFEATSSITFKAGGNVVVHGAPNVHVNPTDGGGSGTNNGASPPDPVDPVVGEGGLPEAEPPPEVAPLVAKQEIIEPPDQPDKPPPDQPPEEEEVIAPCKLIKTKVTCSHGREANQDRKSEHFRVLQVVARGEGRTSQSNMNTWAGGAGVFSTSHKAYSRQKKDDGSGYEWKSTLPDTIKLEGTVEGPCDSHPTWRWNGPDVKQESRQGTKGDFKVWPHVVNKFLHGLAVGTEDIAGLFDDENDGSSVGRDQRAGNIARANNAGGLADFGSKAKGKYQNTLGRKGAFDVAVRGLSMPLNAVPNTTVATFQTCHRDKYGESMHQYKIQAYPSDQIKIKVVCDLTAFSKRFGGWASTLVSKFTERLGGKIEIASNITLLVEGEWKEHTDWRVYYHYKISLNGEPFLGISVDWSMPLTAMAFGAIGVVVQKLLKDVVDAGSLHLKIATDVGGEGLNFQRTSPDSSAIGAGNITATLTISVYIEAFIWSKWFASAKAEGRSTIQLSLKAVEKLPPSTPPKYRPHFTWYPLTLEVQGGVMWWRASRSWECFDKYERFWGEQNLLPSKANNYLGK